MEWMPDDAEVLVLVVIVFLRVTGHRRSLLRVHDGRKRGRPGHSRTELRGRHDGRSRLHPVSPGTRIRLKRVTAVVGSSTFEKRVSTAWVETERGQCDALSRQNVQSHLISFVFGDPVCAVICLGGTLPGNAAGSRDEFQEGEFEEHINLEIVKAQRICTREGEAILRELVERHVALTGSAKGEEVLAKWSDYLPRFWQLVPPGEFRELLRFCPSPFQPSTPSTWIGFLGKRGG